MEQVLKLQPTKRDPTRMMVRVGTPPGRGRVAVTLPAEVVTELGLTVGRPWDDALAGRLGDAGAYDAAHRYALRVVGRRAISRGLLDDKLAQRQVGPELRKRVLDRLDRAGLLDDEAFARAVVRETTRAKPAGRRFLAGKLRQRKVDPAVVARVLDALDEDHATPADDAAQTEAVITFARRRANAMARLAPEVRRRRLYGQLARRGFDPDTIRAALEAVDGPADADHADD